MAQCLSQLECMRATCSGAHVATTNEKAFALRPMAEYHAAPMSAVRRRKDKAFMVLHGFYAIYQTTHFCTLVYVFLSGPTPVMVSFFQCGGSADGTWRMPLSVISSPQNPLMTA